MAHPRWTQLVNSRVWIETQASPTPNSQAFPWTPQCLLRSGESQAALRQRCHPGAEGRPITDASPFAIRWPGAPGSGRLQTAWCPWVRATGSALTPEPGKAKQCALSTLESSRGRGGLTATPSILRDYVGHPGGGQKTQVWPFQNLASELLMCSIFSFFGLEFGPFSFFPYPGRCTPNYSPVWRTGAWSAQHLELMEGSNEFDETR